MKTKKIWKDRKGALGVGIAIAAVILILGIAAIAVYAYGQGMFNDPDDSPDQDRDGDGKEDPIIGYIKITAELVLDNTAVPQITGEYKRYVGDINVELVADAPDPTQFFDIDLQDMWAHDEELKMKFTVNSPTFDTAWVGYDTQKLSVGGTILDNYKTASMSPTNTLGVRYHGNYEVTCTIYEMGGALVDSKSLTVAL